MEFGVAPLVTRICEFKARVRGMMLKGSSSNISS